MRSTSAIASSCGPLFLSVAVVSGCWSDSTMDEAAVTGAAGAGEGGGAATDRSESYIEGADADGFDEEGYTFEDPAEALAAIPAEMLPDELHEELEAKLLVPRAEEGGQAFFTDIITIQPGDDITLCTYLDVTDDVTHLHRTLGRQTKYGHHAILQYLETPQEPGTRECPEVDDLDNQAGAILGGTGGGRNIEDPLPANVVTEIPAGAQFVLNHHWINTGSEPAVVQAQMITVPPPPGEELVIARAFTAVFTDFEVAPGSIGDASGECEIMRDTQLVMMVGHEHEWGSHVRAEHMGDTERVIFDHEWEPEMVSQPELFSYPMDAPLTFSAGDRVRMTCQWNNTTDQPLTFPTEMCVLFGWQIGADADETCYNGTWL